MTSTRRPTQTKKPASGRSSQTGGAAKRRSSTTTRATTRKKASTRSPSTRSASTKKTSTRSASTKKASTSRVSTSRVSTKKASTSRAASTTRAPSTKKAPTKKAPAKAAAARTSAAKKPAKKTTAKKTAARKTTTRTSTAGTSARRTQARPTTRRQNGGGSRPVSRSTRPAGGAGRVRKPATASPRDRRARIDVDELSSGFRARRRDDDSPKARRQRRSETSTNRKGRGRSARSGRGAKRGRAPVTDAGERNAAYLTATVVGLTLFGLVMVLSASSVASLHQFADSPFSQFKRQSMWVGIGAVAFIVASRVDYRILRPLAAPLLLLTIGLLVALFIPGVGIHAQGSTRWLGIGGFVIQPSELAKLVFIVFTADLLTRRERRMDHPELTIRPVMLVLVMLSALMILQPKLGTPIIMGAISILMLFVAGARMRSLVGWLLAAVLAASLAAYAAPYRRDRLLAFLNPWEDPQGIGLQAIQSQVGIAEGGLFGVGLGASRAKWGFLPFAHTDFIFAIVAEEVGLIGASALIGGFLLIAWFGFRAAVSAPDRFGSLLAAGITSWLLVQAFLNIGMVLGVLPITGEALPFVSAGGSSLVTMLAAAGLLTNVSRRSG